MKIIFISLSILLASCGPKTGPVADATDAKSRALSFVTGTPTSGEKTDEGWVVLVKQANGALCEVRMDPATGAFTAAEDQFGPFDYDIHPTDQALTLQQAIVKAKAAQAGNIVAFELKRDDTGVFEWELYVRTDASVLYEIKLTAKDGTLRSAIVKDSVD
jgi:uncharacterized membrane protein YkoI